MCNPACLDFAVRALRPRDITGRRVLEVGAYDVNGSVRTIAVRQLPAEYVGVDVVPGPGVDRLVAAEQVLATYGHGRFDAVLSTEMLEHVVDWRAVVANLKGVLAPGGVLLITTRSPGFGYHPHPVDTWRYTQADMEAIFADFAIEMLESDPTMPGVFLLARKPVRATPPVDLRGIEVLAVAAPLAVAPV